MQTGASPAQRTAVAAGLAAATCLVLYAAFGRPKHRASACAGASDDERKHLIEILAELSRRFFHVCQDVASIAKSVRTKMEGTSMAVPEERLQEQLSRQCKVFEKLQEIQQEVGAQFGCNPEAVEALQARFGDDEEVQAYAAGFKAMLTDALSGTLPVLPNAKVPEELTEERALAIQREVHELETKTVVDKVGGKRLTPQELGQVLVQANKDAWQEVLANHASIIGGGPEVYHSAVAIYMRGEAFAEERKKLDDAHQQQLMRLLQASGRAAAPK